MKTQVIIKNVTSTIDYYNAFMTIQKRIANFPSALWEEVKNRTCIDSKPVGSCKFMRVLNYSAIMGGSWLPKRVIENSRSINEDKIKCFVNRLNSYSRKGNIDAIMFTIERIKKGNRARLPKGYTAPPEGCTYTGWFDEDERIALSKGARKHFDFYDEGVGYTFNDDEKWFIFEFVNKYFNIKE